jgi:hypothetical protein
VRAPVVIGIYPMRIARFVTDGGFMHGTPNGYGSSHAPMYGHAPTNGHAPVNGAAQMNGHSRPSTEPRRLDEVPPPLDPATGPHASPPSR